MSYTQEQLDNRQHKIFTFPADKVYIVQEFETNGYQWKWSTFFNDFDKDLMDFKTAQIMYSNSTAKLVRLSEVSRYLVDGEMVVTQVINCRSN